MYRRFRKFYNSMLEFIVIFLMVLMTFIVAIAVIYRKAGASLSWYDEVASILLAWLTYYGAALAALSGGHIGFSGLLNTMKPKLRIYFVIIGEICVFGFFILLNKSISKCSFWQLGLNGEIIWSLAERRSSYEDCPHCRN